MSRTSRSSKHVISISLEDGAFRGDARAAARALRRALLFCGAAPSAVALFLVKNASMAHLNAVYRGKKGPTTVLSFTPKGDFPHPELGRGGLRYIGEIYLAPRVIRARGDRAVRMAVHGVLHLLGYAHEKKNDRMVMETRETEILAELEPHSRNASRRTLHSTKRYATHHRRT